MRNDAKFHYDIRSLMSSTSDEERDSEDDELYESRAGVWKISAEEKQALFGKGDRARQLTANLFRSLVALALKRFAERTQGWTFYLDPLEADLQAMEGNAMVVRVMNMDALTDVMNMDALTDEKTTIVVLSQTPAHTIRFSKKGDGDHRCSRIGTG